MEQKYLIAVVLIPIINYTIDVSIKLMNKHKLLFWTLTDKFKIGKFPKIFAKIMPTSIFKFKVLQINCFYLQKVSC